MVLFYAVSAVFQPFNSSIFALYNKASVLSLNSFKETYSVMSDSGSVKGIQVNEREVRDSVHTASNDLHSVKLIKSKKIAISNKIYLKILAHIHPLMFFSHTLLGQTDLSIHSHSVVTAAHIDSVHRS